MKDIIQEYGNEYKVVIAYRPDEELLERCKKEGHDMVRTRIIKWLNIHQEDKTRENITSFDDTCKVCGLGLWYEIIEDEYNKLWIVNDNKCDFAVNVALKNSRPVYYEFEIPTLSMHPSPTCTKHHYRNEYACIMENGQQTLDSVIIRHDFKIEYKVGKCSKCSHARVTIIPISVKNKKKICLQEKDFPKEWKSFSIKRLTIPEKKHPKQIVKEMY